MYLCFVSPLTAVLTFPFPSHCNCYTDLKHATVSRQAGIDPKYFMLYDAVVLSHLKK